MAQAFVSRCGKLGISFGMKGLSVLFTFAQVFHDALKEQAAEWCWGKDRAIFKSTFIKLG